MIYDQLSQHSLSQISAPDVTDVYCFNCCWSCWLTTWCYSILHCKKHFIRVKVVHRIFKYFNFLAGEFVVIVSLKNVCFAVFPFACLPIVYPSVCCYLKFSLCCFLKIHYVFYATNVLWNFYFTPFMFYEIFTKFYVLFFNLFCFILTQSIFTFRAVIISYLKIIQPYYLC